jgi:methyl-accepting chemotaxis protein
METWGVVFLGVIALAAVVQAAFVIGLAVFGRRLGRRLDALQTRLDREITPALGNLTRVSRNAAEISDLATLQARRIDLLLSDTIEKIEETTTVVQQLVLRPLKPLAEILAFVKGLQRGLDVYFRLDRDRRPHAPHVPRRRGHPEDEEHLFI